MTRGAHHIHRHVKKRVSERHVEEKIEDSAFRRGIDKLVLIIAFLAPLVELPQLIEIYALKAAGSVSLLTWSMFVVFGVPWLIYGIIHKEKPVIILYSLWIIIDSAIVVGILLYG